MTKLHSEFYEYQGLGVSLSLPVYLHEKKGGGLFFEPRSKKATRNVLLGIALEFQGNAGQVRRDIMMRMTPGITDEVQGSRRHVIRRGDTQYLANGLDLLVSVLDASTGEAFHYYDVLFPLGSRHIYAGFIGQGELSEFDKLCKQIASSIRLVEGGEAAATRQSHRRGGGLNHADRLRLAEALDSLPSGIAYLRAPILAIATQDQDLLRVGEGDLKPLERAMKQIAEPDELRSIAKAHAEILHEWLLTLPAQGGQWAAPAGFVEGALRGMAAWS